MTVNGKILFILLAVVSGVSSTCQCYENSPYIGKTAPISNSYDSDSFTTCYTHPCEFVAYGGDDNHTWTHLTFRWTVVSECEAKVEIFDGTTEDADRIIVIEKGENVLDGSKKSKIKSSSPKILIKYSQTGNGTNVFYGAIRAIPSTEVGV